MSKGKLLERLTETLIEDQAAYIKKLQKKLAIAKKALEDVQDADESREGKFWLIADYALEQLEEK